MISDKLLSKMMNSLSFALSIFAVGIAIALEIMEMGIALSRLSLKVYPWVLNQNPRKTQRVTIEKKANPSVLESNGSFSLVIFNSSVPSKTMRINPTVPSSGTTLEKSGLGQSIRMTSCCESIPSPSRMIIFGILVFGEITSNK